MKFIKNGVIYEPHNDFVIAQMQKSGFNIYEEQKSVKTEEKACENVEATSEKPKEAQKKKKK